MPDLADVLKGALILPIDDRAALADRLLASLDELDEDEAERPAQIAERPHTQSMTPFRRGSKCTFTGVGPNSLQKAKRRTGRAPEF